MVSPLNPKTVEHLKQQHPVPERFEQFLTTCQLTPRQAIRVTKTSQSIFRQWANQHDWQLTDIPWNTSGFWIQHDEERSLGNHIGHLAGHFYIQEATSMLPVAALRQNHKPRTILDMAAAPGSKTTQLAQVMSEQSLIVANDMSSSRTKMLNANLIRMGISNYALLNRDGTKLPGEFSGQFDSILLDAPCGGEGTIRKDPKAWHNWSLESLNELSGVQKALINSAWELLTPGGRLVYSTCSLSREENQDIVSHLLKNQPGAKLIDLSSLFNGAKEINDHGMLHVWPEVLDTEGFFVACLEKPGEYESTLKKTVTQDNGIDRKLLNHVRGYYRDHFGISLPEDADRIKATVQGNKTLLLLLPEYTIEAARFQRHGIHLSTVIDGRKGPTINTHHDFVRCYGQQAQTNIHALTAEEAVTFFQGKNLVGNNTNATGETILLFEGRAIGLAKLLKGGQLKNQLPRELVHDRAWG